MIIATSNGIEFRINGPLVRIARLELDKYEFLDSPAEAIQGLKNVQHRVDLFTFLQRLPKPLNTDNSPAFDYPFEWDNLAVLSIDSFDHWWKNQIRSVPRNRARQAEKKGITVREVNFDASLVKGIWEIYNESPIRQGVRFRHYGRSIEWVSQHAGTFLDRSIFIGAFLDGNLIGFIKLVTDEARTQANTMHIVSMNQHRDKAPTNALIAQAVRSCADRGIRYLVYQNFVYGNKGEDSLSHFKSINGFQRVNLPRYYVPVTRWGHLAFNLRLHRRLVDQLPEGMGEKIRDVRKVWYSSRFRSAGNA